MKNWRLILLVAMTLGAVASYGQAWSETYAKALASAKEAQWTATRASFLEAVALRPEDQSNATILPGPVTEPVQWRGGAPYSPNFGAAYAAYRIALLEKEDAKRVEMYGTAASELEMLLAKKQTSKELFYVLAQIYAQTRNTEAQRKLEDAFKAIEGKADWRVDNSFMDPQEIAAIRSASSQTQAGGSVVNPGTSGDGKMPTIKAGDLNPGTGAMIGTITGRVPTNPYKFALIIGNSESRLPDQKIDFATTDAMAMREALVQAAGYEEGNVEIITNGTAAQIRATAQALSDRMPQEATLFFYFTGVGANVDDKDYYAGIDTESLTDTSSMISKSELLTMFIKKAAKIFAFHQANRPIDRGNYFGREIGIFGRVSQAQATVPGGKINGTVTAGQPIGVYTNSIISVLNEFRSNAVPVTEFCWQVFYNVRRGNTGTTGGGSLQTPTLPVITNMASDARF